MIANIARGIRTITKAITAHTLASFNMIHAYGRYLQDIPTDNIPGVFLFEASLLSDNQACTAKTTEALPHVSTATFATCTESIIPSYKLVSRKHGSHWHRGRQSCCQISRLVLLDRCLIRNDYGRKAISRCHPVKVLHNIPKSGRRISFFCDILMCVWLWWCWGADSLGMLSFNPGLSMPRYIGFPSSTKPCLRRSTHFKSKQPSLELKRIH